MSFRRAMMLAANYVRKVIQDMTIRISNSYFYENDADLEKTLNDINTKDVLSTASFLLTGNAIRDGGLTMPYTTTPNKNLTFLKGTSSTKINSVGNIILNGEQNLLINSTTFNNQLVTVSAGTYNLSFNGLAGRTITLSGASTGTLTGTGIGNRVDLTFTATTGILGLTRSAAVTLAQLTNTSNVQQYMPTTTRLAIPSFDYQLPNTPGLLMETTRTNFLLNSAILSTQTVNINVGTPGGVSYVFSFYGTGSVTLTGGATVLYSTYSGNTVIINQVSTVLSGTNAVLVGTGSNDRVFITFTNPSFSAVTFNVSGSVINAQLEYGNTTISLRPSSYIPTLLTSVSRTGDRIQVGNSTVSGFTSSNFTFFIEFYQKYWSQSNIATFVNGTDTVTNSQFSLRNSTKVFISPNNGAAQLETIDIFMGYNKTVFTLNTTTNKMKIWQNGVYINEFTPTTAFTQINSFSIGPVDSTIYKTIATWATPLTDEQCLKLSTF